MHSRNSVIIASVIALMVSVACGDSRSPATPSPLPSPGQSDPAPAPAPTPTPTPTPAPTPTPGPDPTPTPTPAPTPTPTPAPTPTPPPGQDETLVFTPDTTTPASHSFSLQPAEKADNDDLYVFLYAHDFGGVNGVNTINMVRATITFDPSIVTLASYTSRDSWMESFGYQATFQVTKSGSNQIKVRVDSKDSFDGASGSGPILRLRFRKVASGTSRLEIIDGKAYGASFNDNLQAMHGGTLTVK